MNQEEVDFEEVSEKELLERMLRESVKKVLVLLVVEFFHKYIDEFDMIEGVESQGNYLLT